MGLPGGASTGATARPLAVATNTILADLTAQVAGERWDVYPLLPPGADPHGFEPTPRDARHLAAARAVILVGGGYETPALVRMIRSAASRAEVVSMEPLLMAWADLKPGTGEGGGQGEDGSGQGEQAGEVDPHFWTSVPAVIRAVERIRDGLAQADPEGAQAYRHAARAYIERLQELDAWVREQVARIPRSRRLLVTNHDTLRYFAREYGFTVEGSLIPSVSPLAEPSAADVARLLRRLGELRVPAIFVETTLSPALARRVAQETGARVVVLYTDSLGEPGSGAHTYEQYVRTNVQRIVQALGGVRTEGR